MNEAKTKKLKPIHIALAAIGIVILGLLAFWAWSNFSPKPLGDKLEYIGKSDHGCVIMFCDSRPGSIYYYATDMSLEELQNGFFKNSSVILLDNVSGTSSGGYSFDFLELKNQHINTPITLYFYRDGLKATKHMNLKSTSKKYILSLDAKDYSLIKELL